MAHHATAPAPTSAPLPHLPELGVYGFDHDEPATDAVLARLDIGLVMGHLGMRSQP